MMWHKVIALNLKINKKQNFYFPANIPVSMKEKHLTQIYFSILNDF